jgi:divalent metal cation (Fe/Co/Zn/Cd) transporter
MSASLVYLLLRQVLQMLTQLARDDGAKDVELLVLRHQVADGMHARTDGFTSLPVVLGAGGAALGWWADRPVGFGITAAIAVVLFDAARQVYRRFDGRC